MSDFISRADAIDAVHKYFVDKINNEPHEIDEDGDDVFTDMKSVNALFHHNKMVSKAIKALPSAVAEPKWNCTANFIAEQLDRLRNMTDEERWDFFIRFFSPSADAVHGEWIRVGHDIYECSLCHQNVMTKDIDCYSYCHRCGARMNAR